MVRARYSPSASPALNAISTPIRRTRWGCCARAETDDVAIPQRSRINSRRLIAAVRCLTTTWAEFTTHLIRLGRVKWITLG
jgi:hypothetical protein